MATTIDVESFCRSIFAIAVGFPDYPRSSLSRIPHARLDAARFARVLTSATGMGVPVANVFICPDSISSASMLRDYLRDTVKSLPTGSTLYLYFSGHGVSFSNDNDFVLATPEFEDNTPAGIRGSELGELLDVARLSSLLVVLDCCRGARFVQSAPSLFRLSSVAGSRFAILLSATSAGDEESLDDSRLEGTVFTHYLCKLIDGQLTIGDQPGLVYYYDLVKFLGTAVAEYRSEREVRGEQNVSAVGTVAGNPLLFLSRVAAVRDLRLRHVKYTRQQVRQRVGMTIAGAVSLVALAVVAAYAVAESSQFVTREGNGFALYSGYPGVSPPPYPMLIWEYDRFPLGLVLPDSPLYYDDGVLKSFGGKVQDVLLREFGRFGDSVIIADAQSLRDWTLVAAASLETHLDETTQFGSTLPGPRSEDASLLMLRVAEQIVGLSLVVDLSSAGHNSVLEPVLKAERVWPPGPWSQFGPTLRTRAAVEDDVVGDRDPFRTDALPFDTALFLRTADFDCSPGEQAGMNELFAEGLARSADVLSLGLNGVMAAPVSGIERTISAMFKAGCSIGETQSLSFLETLGPTILDAGPVLQSGPAAATGFDPSRLVPLVGALLTPNAAKALAGAVSLEAAPQVAALAIQLLSNSRYSDCTPLIKQIALAFPGDAPAVSARSIEAAAELMARRCPGELAALDGMDFRDDVAFGQVALFTTLSPTAVLRARTLFQAAASKQPQDVRQMLRFGSALLRSVKLDSPDISFATLADMLVRSENADLSRSMLASMSEQERADMIEVLITTGNPALAEIGRREKLGGVVPYLLWMVEARGTLPPFDFFLDGFASFVELKGVTWPHVIDQAKGLEAEGVLLGLVCAFAPWETVIPLLLTPQLQRRSACAETIVGREDFERLLGMLRELVTPGLNSGMLINLEASRNLHLGWVTRFSGMSGDQLRIALESLSAIISADAQPAPSLQIRGIRPELPFGTILWLNRLAGSTDAAHSGG